ncbi:MAG: hypothetical protein KA436_02980 [Oligoflexales bacterium]|nr:hypothetical protein [Oligoflexales bacterium]
MSISGERLESPRALSTKIIVRDGSITVEYDDVYPVMDSSSHLTISARITFGNKVEQKFSYTSRSGLGLSSSSNEKQLSLTNSLNYDARNIFFSLTKLQLSLPEDKRGQFLKGAYDLSSDVVSAEHAEGFILSLENSSLKLVQAITLRLNDSAAFILKEPGL